MIPGCLSSGVLFLIGLLLMIEFREGQNASNEKLRAHTKEGCVLSLFWFIP